ncbi:hypothetical protein HPB49_018486 [Dermacentor silvarum]|uniref:Uncharacterized protein n=1 Tax=Dermacentor silvarum TaxID=543639 RepID=A0ACB8CSM8_DERSI|nr:hypothetical protein HPB49_018486 [Dermacentor silvarum]
MSLAESITAKMACNTPSKVEVGTQSSLPLADKSVGCSFEAGSLSRSMQTMETVEQSSTSSVLEEDTVRPTEARWPTEASRASWRQVRTAGRLRRGPLVHRAMSSAYTEQCTGKRRPFGMDEGRRARATLKRKGLSTDP